MGWGDKRWTEDEKLSAFKLARQGYTTKEIGQKLGRSHGSVDGLWRRLNWHPTRAIGRSKRNYKQEYEARRGARPRGGSVRTAGLTFGSFEPPPEVVAARDARLSEPRTQTMEFCGDPPPSQSALKRFCP